jgi:hypothetical protein
MTASAVSTRTTQRNQLAVYFDSALAAFFVLRPFDAQAMFLRLRLPINAPAAFLS